MARVRYFDTIYNSVYSNLLRTFWHFLALFFEVVFFDVFLINFLILFFDVIFDEFFDICLTIFLLKFFSWIFLMKINFWTIFFDLQGISYWRVAKKSALRGRRIHNFIELWCLVTPARTLFISGLKSRVLKPTFLS